nr:GDSL esterase/lipase At5g03820-like [Tanacetum cinerariifolium]
NLYSLGVRKIGVTTLPPTGCLPAAITLFGMGSNNCISSLNNDAAVFNKKLNATSSKLIARFPDLKLVVFDVYHPLLDMITKPAENGFYESRRGCCGTGILETSILCNARSIGTPRLVILQCAVVLVLLIKINADDPIVPALCIFGDSVMDVGNNNNRLSTLLRANFLPYGRDFVTHTPTGRFCNGKIAVD